MDDGHPLEQGGEPTSHFAPSAIVPYRDDRLRHFVPRNVGCIYRPQYRNAENLRADQAQIVIEDTVDADASTFSDGVDDHLGMTSAADDEDVASCQSKLREIRVRSGQIGPFEGGPDSDRGQ